MADKITVADDGSLSVSDQPIIPFIEGDGTGVDIWPAAKLVLDAAAKKYGKSISWKEVLAGEKAYNETGDWLPQETIDIFKEYLIGIKGPLTTPVGGGFRSLNVALRQLLDLYVCLRPIRWFEGVPSPVKRPDLVDMVIFRENTEDIYAGLELQEGTPEAKRLIELLHDEYGWHIRPDSGIGIKPVSITGSKRLIRASLNYAVRHGRKSVTLVHKGNIQKFTEGAFRNWGYDLVKEEFADVAVGWDDCGGQPGDKILVKDNIADITLQQVLTRPDDFDVIATTNLNGDYLSDALAAQVGGIGIAPGANINYVSGHGIFEATHGTAPKYAGQDKVNPGSVLLSGVMMFEHLGWQDAADDIITALQATIADKIVTYDFARQMDGRHGGQDLGVRARHRRTAVGAGHEGPFRRLGRGLRPRHDRRRPRPIPDRGPGPGDAGLRHHVVVGHPARRRPGAARRPVLRRRGHVVAQARGQPGADRPQPPHPGQVAGPDRPAVAGPAAAQLRGRDRPARRARGPRQHRRQPGPPARRGDPAAADLVGWRPGRLRQRPVPLRRPPLAGPVIPAAPRGVVRRERARRPGPYRPVRGRVARLGACRPPKRRWPAGGSKQAAARGRANHRPRALRAEHPLHDHATRPADSSTSSAPGGPTPTWPT